MKKKLLTTILVLSLVTLGLAGCQKEDTPTDAPTDVQEESTDTDTDTDTDTTIPETSLQTCGGCEVEKECGTYTVDGTDYYVCDDCYEEFAYGMGLE